MDEALYCSSSFFCFYFSSLFLSLCHTLSFLVEIIFFFSSASAAATICWIPPPMLWLTADGFHLSSFGPQTPSISQFSPNTVLWCGENSAGHAKDPNSTIFFRFLLCCWSSLSLSSLKHYFCSSYFVGHFTPFALAPIFTYFAPYCVSTRLISSCRHSCMRSPVIQTLQLHYNHFFNLILPII